MLDKKLTEAEFCKDVATHELTVLIDMNVYRHLRLKRPGSNNMRFDIVTWPGYLAYSGDMGCFVFNRLNDMFCFFRHGQDADGSLSINESYWSEKLEAVDRNGREGSFQEFSPEKFREHVEDDIRVWVDELDTEYDSSEEDEKKERATFEAALREELKDSVLNYVDDGPHEAYRALRDFSFEYGKYEHNKRKYEFQDAWEWNCSEYTLRFTWCCYALVWAIRKYDAHKAASPTTTSEGTA